jgi:hypothetical protein
MARVDAVGKRSLAAIHLRAHRELQRASGNGICTAVRRFRKRIRRPRRRNLLLWVPGTPRRQGSGPELQQLRLTAFWSCVEESQGVGGNLSLNELLRVSGRSQYLSVSMSLGSCKRDEGELYRHFPASQPYFLPSLAETRKPLRDNAQRLHGCACLEPYFLLASFVIHGFMKSPSSQPHQGQRLANLSALTGPTPPSSTIAGKMANRISIAFTPQGTIHTQSRPGFPLRLRGSKCA